jgi:4-hydroxyphenylpyruvate dioxygenase
MKKSIATVSLPGTLPKKLEAIAAAGFQGVEIFEPNLKAFNGSPRDVGRHARELGLTIELFQPLRDFEGVPAEQLRGNLDRADIAFDIMGELGAPLLLVCANTGANVVDDEELAASQLHELAERAGRRGVKIGYEALAWSTSVNTFDKAFRIVESVDSPNLGLILDSFHTLMRPDDWSSLSTLPGSRISFLQVGDAQRMDTDFLTVRRHHSRLPGEGDLDVAGFLRAVLVTGYTGSISLEIFNENASGSPLEAAQAAMNSLLRVEECARVSKD